MPVGSAIPPPMRVVAVLVLLPLPVLLVLIWTSQAGPASALLSYSALIATMLGSSHWFLATGPYGRARIAVEGLSGLAVLIAAGIAVMAPLRLGFLILIAVYFLLILRDALKQEAADLPDWYARWRAYIAAGASVTAILALIRILT